MAEEAVYEQCKLLLLADARKHVLLAEVLQLRQEVIVLGETREFYSQPGFQGDEAIEAGRKAVGEEMNRHISEGRALRDRLEKIDGEIAVLRILPEETCAGLSRERLQECMRRALRDTADHPDVVQSRPAPNPR